MDEGGARIVSAQRVQRQFASCRLHIPDGCNAVCHSWLDESTTKKDKQDAWGSTIDIVVQRQWRQFRKHFA